jgi:imidazolonepropionase-like amidohydrolase
MDLGMTPPTIVIRAERMIDGTGAAPVPDVSILIADGRIAAIEQGAIGGEHQTVDLGDLTLLPGLIDTHVHLTVGHSPWKMETFIASTPQWQLLYAVENGRSALESGITTLRDCGGRKELLLPLRDAIAVGAVRGPRLLVAGPPVTTTAGHMWYFGLEADGIPELRTSVRQLAKDGVDFIKIAASGGGMTPGSNPRAPQYTVEELATIVEEAARLGKSATAHCLATESVRRAVAAELPMIEHAAYFRGSTETGTIGFISANGFDYRPDVAEQIAARGIPVSQAIIGWHRGLHHSADRFAPEERALLEAELEHRRAHLQDMRARGIRFLAGSDGMDDIPRDYFATLELTNRDIGLTPLETIAHATAWPADALGIGGETGAIAVGKAADLLAVGGDPSTDISRLRDARWVMARGQVIVDRRKG